MRPVRVIVATHLAATAALLACTSTTTSEPRPASPVEDAAAEADDDAATDAGPDDADAGSCALPGIYGSKECQACVAARCCDEVTACQADAPCRDLNRCALDCLLTTDAGGCLRQECFATYPSGRTLWDPLYRCWFATPPQGCLVECTN